MEFEISSEWSFVSGNRQGAHDLVAHPVGDPKARVAREVVESELCHPCAVDGNADIADSGFKGEAVTHSARLSGCEEHGAAERFAARFGERIPDCFDFGMGSRIA